MDELEQMCKRKEGKKKKKRKREKGVSVALFNMADVASDLDATMFTTFTRFPTRFSQSSAHARTHTHTVCTGTQATQSVPPLERGRLTLLLVVL